jgi:hypothetical protein
MNEPLDKSATATTSEKPGSQKLPSMQKGNREVITDHFLAADVTNEPTAFAHKVFVRLNARKRLKFTKVSFQHCVFDGCYINSCTFDSCDFTGARFSGCNFHQSSFPGCKFDYAIFERCQVDDDILVSEAPLPENLRMRFARTLRMNYQQIGDAKAVNKAISLELNATAEYLFKSWRSEEHYYKTKYSGVRRVQQFLRWLEFWILNFVWGNGESIVKLMRSIAILIGLIALYDTTSKGNYTNLAEYWYSLQDAPSIFLGVLTPKYPSVILASIAACRLISVALLTALLVKRFGRR